MTVAKNHISQGANEPTNSYGNASPSDPNQADPEPTSTVYRMDERPGYESMVTYVTDKLDHYKDEILNNNTMFMSEYRIPDTQNGTEADLLPDLSDARLLWAENNRLRFAGFERVDNANYAQTWEVEVTEGVA